MADDVVIVVDDFESEPARIGKVEWWKIEDALVVLPPIFVDDVEGGTLIENRLICDPLESERNSVLPRKVTQVEIDRSGLV